MNVPRSEFAYVKKMTGPYSPQAALMAVGRLHQQWVRNAGGEFCGNKMATDREDAKCEVSPLVSYDGEDLSGQFWMPIELPFYLPSKEEETNYTAVEIDRHRRPSLHFIDWESEYAKQNLEQELHFALEKVLDSTPADPHYKGEPAAYWEELPPTPEDSDVEEHIGEVQATRSRSSTRLTTMTGKGRDARRLPTSVGDVESDALAAWLLGKRVKYEDSEALIGCPRMQQEKVRGNCLLTAMEDRDRFRNSRRHRDDDEERKGGISPRNTVIMMATMQQKLSLRAVPPGRQGLEISEYGVRMATMKEASSPWWNGPPDHLKDPLDQSARSSVFPTTRQSTGNMSPGRQVSGDMSPGGSTRRSGLNRRNSELELATRKNAKVVVPPGLECTIS